MRLGTLRRVVSMGLLALVAALGIAVSCPGAALAESVEVSGVMLGDADEASVVADGAGASGSASGGSARAGYPASVAGTTDFNYARQVLAQLNATRAAAGLSTLGFDEELSYAAMVRAAEISVRFSTTRPNGSEWYTISTKVEGMTSAHAYGYVTPAKLIDEWMGNADGRDVILEPQFKSVGIGCVIVDGEYYFVQLFSTQSAQGSVISGTYSAFLPTQGVAMEGNGRGSVMQRLYNAFTGEHFYTANIAETYKLVSIGWRYEGVGWYAPASGAEVYRLYNPYVPGGDHHYTLSASERDGLVAAGWRYEGVGWRSAPASTGVCLYRQYNPFATTGTHNYTTSLAENNQLVLAGWRAEGVAWYGV